MYNSKKIVIIQPFLSYGGAEAVSIQLAHQLNRKGISVKLIALYKDTRLPYLSDKVDIVMAPKPLSTFFSKSKLFSLVFGFPILILLVLKKSDKNAVLNPHNFPSPWVAVVVGKIRKIPVVWTVHNFPQTPYKSYFAKKLISYLDRFLVKRCEVIVAVSKKVKRQIKENYGLGAKVIYPAIDFEFWSKGNASRVKNRYGLNKKYIILSVGRLKKEKNHELTLKAFSRALRTVGDTILIIVGDGENLVPLKGLAKREGVSGKVHFVGYQPAEMLRDFYSAADLNLLPAYKTEGFNLSPLEALCNQTVSIVAKGSGIDELFEKEGIGLAVKSEAEDFAKAIIYAYQNKAKISETGTKGKRWIKENLNWEEYSRKFLELV